MLVPYPVRVVFWVALLALLVWTWFSLDGALERHYTATQRAQVAEDASQANAIALKAMTSKEKRTRAVLADREKRLAALGAQIKDQDDEMERLKRDAVVAEWAKGAVPDAVRARHGVR